MADLEIAQRTLGAPFRITLAHSKLDKGLALCVHQRTDGRRFAAHRDLQIAYGRRGEVFLMSCGGEKNAVI